MAKTIGQLVNQAVEIRDERDTGDNTATRVGEMFIAIIEHLRDVSDVNSSGNGNNSSISLTGLLSSLSGMTDPNGTLYPNGAVLKYSGGSWGYDNYGGGTTTTTPGGGLTVAQLWTELNNPTTQYASGKKIPATYLDLSGCLSTATTFWGQTANNGAVKGSLTGDINFIQFSNGVKIGVDAETNTIKVYRDDLSAAHFYATGGVSALGNSSSGSGNSSQNTSGLPLDSAILVHINGNTDSNVGNPSSGNVVYYDGQWKYKTLNLQDLGNVTLSNLPSTSSDVTHVLTYDNTFGIWKNAAISTTGGASNLNGLSDVTISGISNANSYPVVLSKLKSTDTDFVNTPLSNLFAAGNGISITTQTGTGSNNNKLLISLSPADTSTIGGIRIGYTQNGKNYPVVLSDNKAYVNVPWENTEYNAATTSTLGLVQIGNGIDVTPGGSISTSISKLMGTSNVGDATHPIYWVGSGSNQGWNTIDLNNGWVTLGTAQTITGQKTFAGTSSNNPIFTNSPLLNSGAKLYAKEGSNNPVSIIELSAANSGGFSIAAGSRSSYPTNISGNSITLRSMGNSTSVMELSAAGRVYLPQATQASSGLRIGDAILYWDNSNGNNSLALVKSDGTACNFYATGGVSALGLSPGTSSISAMTFNNLAITNRITLTDTEEEGGSSSIHQNADGELIIEGSEKIVFDNDVILNNPLYSNGNNIRIDGGGDLYIYDEGRIYFSSSNYLFMNSNGNLVYHKGQEGDLIIK